jgi:tetratricopeptide (TPR) repeat protein
MSRTGHVNESLEMILSALKHLQSSSMNDELSDLHLKNNLAVLNLQAGNIAAAKALLAELMVKHPGLPKVWQLAGMVSLQEGDFGRAAKHFEKSLEIFPRFEAAVEMLEAAKNAGLKQAEIKSLLAKPFPDHADNAALGSYFFSIGDYRNASIHMRKVVSDPLSAKKELFAAFSFFLGQGGIAMIRDSVSAFKTRFPDDEYISNMELDLAEREALEAEYSKFRERIRKLIES